MKSEMMMWRERNWGMCAVACDDERQWLVPLQPLSATVCVSQMAKKESTILCSGEAVDPRGEEEMGRSVDVP